MSLVIPSILYGCLIFAGVTLIDRYFPATTQARNAIGSAGIVFTALSIQLTIAYFLGVFS